MDRFQHEIPVAFGVNWADSGLTLPEQKAREAKLLHALIKVAEMLGASNVEVGDIIEEPGQSGKVVTFLGEGTIDADALGRELRRHLDEMAE